MCSGLSSFSFHQLKSTLTQDKYFRLGGLKLTFQFFLFIVCVSGEAGLPVVNYCLLIQTLKTNRREEKKESVRQKNRTFFFKSNFHFIILLLYISLSVQQQSISLGEKPTDEKDLKNTKRNNKNPLIFNMRTKHTFYKNCHYCIGAQSQK